MAKAKYGVFLSYASQDERLATELLSMLEETGMKCFLAKRDIGAGEDWLTSIREALILSERVVILLTPNSVSRPWVLLETGAAWAINLKIFPAVSFVEPGQLVAPLQKLQVRSIDTTEDRVKFVREVATYTPPVTTPAVRIALLGLNEEKTRWIVRVEPQSLVPFKGRWYVKATGGASLTNQALMATEHFPEEGKPIVTAQLTSNNLDAIEFVTLRYDLRALHSSDSMWLEIDYRLSDMSVLDARQGQPGRV